MFITYNFGIISIYKYIYYICLLSITLVLYLYISTYYIYISTYYIYIYICLLPITLVSHRIDQTFSPFNIHNDSVSK